MEHLNGDWTGENPQSQKLRHFVGFSGWLISPIIVIALLTPSDGQSPTHLCPVHLPPTLSGPILRQLIEFVWLQLCPMLSICPTSAVGHPLGAQGPRRHL